jgi:hypothetical protein
VNRFLFFILFLMRYFVNATVVRKVFAVVRPAAKLPWVKNPRYKPLSMQRPSVVAKLKKEKGNRNVKN